MHFQKWKKILQSKRDWKQPTTTTKNKLCENKEKNDNNNNNNNEQKVDGKVTKYGFNKPARCVDGDVKVSKQAN